MKKNQFKILSRKLGNLNSEPKESCLATAHKWITILGTLATISFAFLTYNMTKYYNENNQQLAFLRKSFYNAHTPFLQIDYKVDFDTLVRPSKPYLMYELTNSGGHLQDLVSIKKEGFKTIAGIRKNFGSNSSFKNEFELPQNFDSISGIYKFHYFDRLDRKFEQNLVIELNNIKNFYAEFDPPIEIDSTGFPINKSYLTTQKHTQEKTQK